MESESKVNGDESSSGDNKDAVKLQLSKVKSDTSCAGEEKESDHSSQGHSVGMSKFLEPPTFISDSKSYAEYKADLKRWTRICGVDKKLQAEMVVYRLEGHPSHIKEKINTQIGVKLEENENGIQELLAFFDSIYTKDDMADAWDRFCEFSYFSKKPEQSMQEFIAEWENCYYKMKNVECEYSDLILAFKLLQASKLNEIETKLVLTGVNYADGKTNKNLLQQVKESLKKFKGRPVVLNDKRSVVSHETLLSSEAEEVLISKGWKPPQVNRGEDPGASHQLVLPGKRPQITKGERTNLEMIDYL
jgi:hypothetical protein